MSATCATDAKIDRAQLEQIMEMLDRDKDGKVTADEFKVPWLKLFPKLKDADFQEALDAVTSELQAEVDGGAD